MTLNLQSILHEAKEMEQEIVNFRRIFHENPELGLEEHVTSDKVMEELKQLNLDEVIKIGTKESVIEELSLLNETIKDTHGPTGVLGVIKGQAGPGPTVLLRADMDALVVNESTDEDHIPYSKGFSSKNDRVMHACGHDAHTAMLLGAAKILSKFKDKLSGTIKFIFQPDEERGCGAKIMCKEGIMEDVDAVFGIHVWKTVDSGKVMIHQGPTMASVDNFWININGGGGHSSSPHETKDPILASSEMVNSIYRMHDRELNSVNASLVTVEQIESKADWGVIPSSAQLRGTIRTFSESDRNYIIKRMTDLCNVTSQFHNLECSFESLNVFPPLNNNREMAILAQDTVSDLLGEEKIETGDPIMSGEDFSYYLKESPGAFIFLGNYNEDKGIIHPHHNPKFDIDEDILHKGTALYISLALKFLNNQ
ncbi:M20 metallopeptidase family protein [Natranaerobius thermophilus]|uniref:Amidohydrolase n=1 Tax=Natranaerobius thermophilus (strain ATCC BAA-1301 / DSM 18059 / JW/NM-WN-LF) TaxID=457570 RepID=B2A4U5_NATTJ|nr:amidohydrolase [Natranaerobius thermophilus]ACB83867.1 amidohydrolase [Natranaerobius thermophilus JW/NM-WN-LF]